jgi:ribosomal protein S18 acetylase RimI-like enzyme
VSKLLTIRKITADDWKLYKQIRLKALTESPDSFGSTFDKEAAFSDEQWKARLSKTAEVPQKITLVAFSVTKPLGLASGIILQSEDQIAQVNQIWVASDFRLMGVGQELLRGIVYWASTLNQKSLVLSVTADNAEAISLYEKFGFITVRHAMSLPSDSHLLVQTMRLTIA